MATNNKRLSSLAAGSRLLRVVIGAAIWLLLMVISYALLFTVPALLLVGFWTAVAIFLGLQRLAESPSFWRRTPAALPTDSGPAEQPPANDR